MSEVCGEERRKCGRRDVRTIEHHSSADVGPDWLGSVDLDGARYVIETRGQENIDVAHKDRAATIWCENATLLTEVTWLYLKVPQIEFGKLQPRELSEAALAFGA